MSYARGVRKMGIFRSLMLLFFFSYGGTLSLLSSVFFYRFSLKLMSAKGGGERFLYVSIILYT